MVTSLNSNLPFRDTGYKLEHTIRRNITFADAPAVPTTISIGGIPSGAQLVGGAIHINTSFDNTTTVLSVGRTDSTAANVSAYASAMVISGASASVLLDDYLTLSAVAVARPTTVTATLSGAVSTAGSVDVTFRYVPSETNV